MSKVQEILDTLSVLRIKDDTNHIDGDKNK